MISHLTSIIHLVQVLVNNFFEKKKKGPKAPLPSFLDINCSENERVCLEIEVQIVAAIAIPNRCTYLDVVENPIEGKVGIIGGAGAVVLALIVIVFVANNEIVLLELFAANLDFVLHCLSFLLVTTR
jgi:hypothetical protein